MGMWMCRHMKQQKRENKKRLGETEEGRDWH